MFKFKVLVALAAAAISPLVYAVNSQTYTWKNVKIGGGGGFVPGIVFNPTEKVRTTGSNDGGMVQIYVSRVLHTHARISVAHTN